MNILRKAIAGVLACAIAFTALLMCVGCGGQKEPVIVTLWHVYGAQADSPLNALIDEFNATVGAEQNIRVQVTSVTNTNTIHENVLSSAYKDPGAPELPDMFISYPKTVLAMPDDTILVDYSEYFSREELDKFIPEFIEEGIVNDRLTVLPVAKSTEIMFINKTDFDRFAADTGAQLSDLETWEGLYGLADDYYAWTDAKTPDINNDGKTFFVHDYHFDYFQVGVESLGENFFDGEQLAFGPAFEQAWDPYVRATLEGGVWLQSGYATEPLRTGDSIVSVASSASVLYYSDTVTYPNNVSEKIELIALPCPVFEGGEKLVMQRGAGVCTVSSTPEKNNACITFLKWLTEPHHNVEFVTSLGYMPVTIEAFENHLHDAIEGLTDPKYKSLYEAFIDTQQEYTFYNAPKLDNYLELETSFEEQVRSCLSYGRQVYIEQGEALESLTDSLLEEFRESYIN